ncbi:MAG: hypothetical protein ACREM1_01285 [Longimicrobiales bacterium]
MFVLVGQSNEVRVFDRTGAHVHSFGRGGSGPGEMRSAALAGWGSEEELWIVDPANGRYSVFSPAGDFLAAYRREISFSMSPWPGAVDKAGRILDVGIRQGERSLRALVRVDPGTASADTFPLPNYEGGQFHLLNAAGLPMRSVSIPFAGQLIWRLDPRGYVWSSVTDRYRIVQQNLEGDTLLIVERAADPIPVTAEERKAALDGLEDFVAAGGRIDASRIPSTKPLLSNFAVDDRGYLWVAVQGSDAEEAAYDVFRPDGRYLGAVSTTTRLAFWPVPPIFSDAFVYGFTLDEMGVPFLVRMRGFRGTSAPAEDARVGVGRRYHSPGPSARYPGDRRKRTCPFPDFPDPLARHCGPVLWPRLSLVGRRPRVEMFRSNVTALESGSSRLPAHGSAQTGHGR